MGLLLNIAYRLFRSPRQEDRWQSMTCQEARTLAEENLALCLSQRMADWEEQDLPPMPHPRRIAYTVWLFDMEVQNGGLCQYFVNSSRTTAPDLSQALDALGAGAYRALLEDFASQNGIDLGDLSSFVISRTKDYEAQTRRYPFDQFDEAYYVRYETDPLERYLTAYVRQHLEEFFP